MQTLIAGPARPWGTSNAVREGQEPSGEDAADPAALSGIPPDQDGRDYETSVCCWNVCANYTAPTKRPRRYSTGWGTSSLVEGTESSADEAQTLAERGAMAASGARSGWKAGASVSEDTPAEHPAAGSRPHLTRRLLVEEVAPGRHMVFNPLSGAVDLATDADLDRLDALRRGEEVDLAPCREAALRERLYLFDTAAEEEAYLDAAVAGAWGRMTRAQPQMYTVCPTLACNLACGYCFEGDSLTDKKQGVMSEAQVGLMFEAIGRLRAQYAGQDDGEAGPPWIALFGGEPLLPSTRRSVAAILRHAADEGFLVCGTTNGVNLTRFEDLLTEYADILTVFQVTLDGPKAVHDARRHRLGGQGTFDEIVRGIDLLLFLGIDVDLRVNLDAANVGSLPELVDFFHAKGWHAHPGFALALAPVTVHDDPAGHGKDGKSGGCGSRYDQALSELDLAGRVMALAEAHPRVAELCHLGFLRHLEYLVSVLEPGRMGIGRRGTGRTPGPRYWYCEASTDKQYVFTPEGLVYSCTEGVGRPEHAVGRFDPALDLWAAERGQWVGRTILSHPKCRECSISTLCGGGCHVAAREAGAGERLLQVALPGRGTDKAALRYAAQPSRAPEPFRSPDPFCNAAEGTVRAYLRAVAQSPAFEARVGSLM